MELRELIGIPYKNHGRDLAGLDCWGLVMVASRELYGVEVPDYNGYADSCNGTQVAPLFDARKDWQFFKTTEANIGDVIVVRLAGYPVHAGIYTGDDFMLHTLHGCNSCLVRISSHSWRQRIEGAYRWKGNCC